MTNYVKFFRGTPNAFNLLTPKDSDTLYFVVEKDALKGKLYLGEQLISDSTSSVEAATKLADLIDVDLAGLGDKEVLTYDATTEKWIPLDITDLVDSDLTADDVDGTTITIDENGKLTANLITYTIESDRNAEDTGIVITLKGSDNSTSSIVIDDIDLSNYYTKTETDNAIADAVSKIGRLKRKVVADLDEAQAIVDADKEAADEYIFMVPNGDGGYDEYMYFPEKDALEKVGSWGGTDLSQYVTETELEEALIIKSVHPDHFTITGENKQLELKAVPVEKITGLSENYVSIPNFNKVVGNLDTLLTKTTTIVQDIDDINLRLTWQEMVE